MHMCTSLRAVYGYGPDFGLEPAWYEDPNSTYSKDIRRLRSEHFSFFDQLLTSALAAARPELSPVGAAVREWNLAPGKRADVILFLLWGLAPSRVWYPDTDPSRLTFPAARAPSRRAVCYG